MLEGFAIALDHLDEVIALIRAARTPEIAQAGPDRALRAHRDPGQRDPRAAAARLTGLERQKILDELAEIASGSRDLKEMLAKPGAHRRDHRDELKEIRENYGDPRRTEIVGAADEIAIEDLIVEEDMAISITHLGYIKRTSITEYRAQRRGGKGAWGWRRGTRTSSRDLFVASTHAYILFFTNRGRVHWLKVHELPDVGPRARARRS